MKFKGIIHKHFILRPVSSLTAGGVFEVKAQDTLPLVLEILREENCGSVIINDEKDQIKGILTERDIILKIDLFGRIQTVEQIMTRNPEVIRRTGSIGKALYMMSIGGFRNLPVVHNSNYADKIISVKDLINYIYGKLKKFQTPEECAKYGEQEQIMRYFCDSVSSFSLKPLVSTTPDATLQQVVDLLRKSQSGAVLIVNGDSTIAGIFTERDFLKSIAGRADSWQKEPVSSYMTATPKVVTDKTSVADSYNMLSEGGFRHLPVVSENGKAMGMLSIKDFLDRLAVGIVEELESLKVAPKPA